MGYGYHVRCPERIETQPLRRRRAACGQFGERSARLAKSVRRMARLARISTVELGGTPPASARRMANELVFHANLVAAMLVGLTPWHELTRADVRAALMAGSEMSAAEADAAIARAIAEGTVVEHPTKPGVLRAGACVRRAA
jgi:hypothetical protein